jgi:signal transduction histidine kinase
MCVDGGTTAPELTAAPERRRPALPRRLGLRARILLGFVVMLALATVGSVLVARQLVLEQLENRIDRDLVQETQELRRLAGGVDPATARPFGGRVRRIFDVFFERNVASRNEAILAFVGGELYRRSAPVSTYRLDDDAELTGRWATLRDAESGHLETPGGDLDYRATPLLFAGRPLGVFVVVHFSQQEREDVESAIRAAGGVGIAILLIGSILAWRLTSRILRPVGLVTRTARSLSETDLSRRIPVEGDDEVAELAATFNGMLDRLETAFAGQRRFLDDAGHELRTPITIVRGHVELLGDDPGERRETVELVTDELDRMSRLVDDLITLAKAERVDFLSREELDAEDLVREIFAKATALGERRWRLGETASGTVLADRQRLTQAVLQLAENAVSHTGEGDEIVLSSRHDEGRLELTVRDTGPGVPPAERERVFERFARGGHRTRRDGSGLGLSIVRAIAEAHGGTARVVDAPRGGAAFTISIPTGREAR